MPQCDQGQHKIYVGRTGSGKTYKLLQDIIEYHKKYPKNSIYIVNPKNTDVFKKLIKPTEKIPKIGKSLQFINWLWMPLDKYSLRKFCYDIYKKKKKCLIVFDEGQMIDHHIPEATLLWVQGREFGTSVYLACQRPVSVSIYSITQASFFIIFNIIGKDDLKKLDSYMDCSLSFFMRPERENNGNLIEGKKLEKYHYLLYDVENGTAVIEKPKKANTNFVIKQPTFWESLIS